MGKRVRGWLAAAGAALLGVGVVPAMGAPAAANVSITTPTTGRTSVTSNGAQANGHSTEPALSRDGLTVAFRSTANNLVAGDDNGHADVFVHSVVGGETERVSVSSSEVEGNDFSEEPSISADGRFVAFRSSATNLVAGDTNRTSDIFVRDRERGTTTRVSVTNDGGQGNGHNSRAAISFDGRFVAFASSSSNLVPGDTNRRWDVFVRDLQAQTTTRVSVASWGNQGNGTSHSPSISDDGRYVAFESDAWNLVFRDNNARRDVFVHDLTTRTTRRVSVAETTGGDSDGVSQAASISDDGRYIAFQSSSSNLVPDDDNRSQDVFVRDMEYATTERVSVASDGTPGNSTSVSPAISPDGRFVVFSAYASNLVTGDSNFLDDVFVRDREGSTTTRASVSTVGAEGNQRSFDPSVSHDGRYVAFMSYASNLVHGDNNGATDVFRRQMT